MKKYDYLIVGAGLFGSVFAYEASKKWNHNDEAYYPINDDKNNKFFSKYQELSKTENNIIFGGILGHYKYYDIGKTISVALELLDKEL